MSGIRFDMRLVACGVTLLTVTACSGASNPLLLAAGQAGSAQANSRNTRPNWISPQVAKEAKAGGLLFVADAANNDIAIFSKRDPSAPIGTISNGISDPEEIAVDRADDLYVANLGAGSVTVYAPPYTAAPLQTFTTGLKYPFSVTVGTDGTVYVTDNPTGSGGILLEYPAGSTTPSETLPIGGYAEGVALDAGNNVYVAYNGASAASVVEFPSGSTQSHDLGLQLGFVSGIVFDNAGNLLVEDQIPATVDVFPPGATQPSRTISNGGNGFGDPVSIAFSTKEKRLYVGDGLNDVVDFINYGNGKTVSQIGGFGRTHGVAVTPAPPK